MLAEGVLRYISLMDPIEEWSAPTRNDISLRCDAPKIVYEAI